MPKDEKKDTKEEDDESTLTCEECGDVFENTANLRRLKNKMNGHFFCPDCLAEKEAARHKEEKKEKAEEEEGEEAEEEDEEEDEEEPEPEAEKPKKKK